MTPSPRKTYVVAWDLLGGKYDPLTLRDNRSDFKIVSFLRYNSCKVTPVVIHRVDLWRKGFALALETHVDIVCEKGFTEENRGPLHVRACISLQWT